MIQKDSHVVTGFIMDEEISLTVDELCRASAAETAQILALVEEGVLEPSKLVEESEQWCFSGASVRRVRIAMRLQRDLKINLAGVALALDLLDEIESLRAGA
jgi:chaperone modulatory protein CbpM